MFTKKYVDAVILACGAQAHYIDGALVILHTASFLDIITLTDGISGSPDIITPAADIACWLMTGIASCLATDIANSPGTIALTAGAAGLHLAAIWDPGCADPRRLDRLIASLEATLDHGQPTRIVGWVGERRAGQALRGGSNTMWYTDDNGKRRFKPRADHPEWQRAARYRNHVIVYRTAVAQALLLLDAVRETRDAAYAAAEEDGPPPEAFDADEAYYFASLWRHYTHDLGYAAEGVHGDGADTIDVEDIKYGAAFNLREALKELDLLIAQFTEDFDFSVKCERLTSA